MPPARNSSYWAPHRQVGLTIPIASSFRRASGSLIYLLRSHSVSPMPRGNTILADRSELTMATAEDRELELRRSIDGSLTTYGPSTNGACSTMVALSAGKRMTIF